jgi:hypothetical protein
MRDLAAFLEVHHVEIDGEVFTGEPCEKRLIRARCPVSSTKAKLTKSKRALNRQNSYVGLRTRSGEPVCFDP